MRKAASAFPLLFALGAAAHGVPIASGTFAISNPPGPYVAGEVPLSTTGTSQPVNYTVIGAGTIDDNIYRVPLLDRAANVTIVASTRNAVALAQLAISAPPPAREPLIAVATYYGGIALHDLRTRALLGIVAANGAPGDVAMDAAGTVAAPLTDGGAMLSVARTPFAVQRIGNVLFGNEITSDGNGTWFVSNRDINGRGFLTRVSNGVITRTDTGITAEGLALDNAASRIYVGNVNSNDIAVLNTQTMQLVDRIPAVPRTFGIALDSLRHRIFAVSNRSGTMNAGGSGYVASIDTLTHRQLARSKDMRFPLGAAFDRRTNSLFVTDEDRDWVAVLNADTLREKHRPLHACAVPWRPFLDERRRRLYVPCARANEIAVYDVDRLTAAGAPFTTGRYPLGVATTP